KPVPVAVGGIEHQSSPPTQVTVSASSGRGRSITGNVIEPKTLSGEPSENVLVFGEVVGIRIDEAIVRDGRLDMSIARTVARMGYMDYSEG
ncbi:hypothetical protein ACC695_38730, partial [Rhizobium ruizarguesonis]